MSVIERLNTALSDRYRIERELGEGGMATVYLADDLRHERRVALKVLKPELAAVVGAERFLAEIKTTANLQHPHILPLFDSGEANRFLYYVMPYVEGETLRDRLERERQLPVDEAVTIATKVAGALGAAHAHGVIHRDIKPANILLADGEPLVADFGIALAVGTAGRGRLTETGLSLGTPHYMSPEQAVGEGNVGPAADNYALGCVLYEMLAGEAPYTGGSAQAILGKIVTGEAVPVTKLRPNVPPNVDAAIRAALERVPADRPANARELARALTDPAFRHGPQHTPEIAERSGALRALPWLVAAAAVVATAIGWGSRVTATSARPLAAFVPVTLETSVVNLATLVDRFTVTPAGDAIVYVSEDSGSGDRSLFLRRLDDLEPKRLVDVGFVSSPTIAPDGAWVALIDGSELVKMPLDGSAPPLPLATAQSVRNVTWGTDGIIRFARATGRGPILAVSERGGPVDSLVFAGDTAAIRAEALPRGRLLMSLLIGSEGRIVVREADGAIRPLTTGKDARLAPSGYLLFARATARGWSLIGAPFDAPRGVIDGPETVLAADVPVAYATGAAGTLSGDLYYLAGGARSDRRVEMLDRTGATTSAGLEPGSWVHARLSPDGRRIAANRWNGAVRTLWVSDLEGGTATQLTFEDGDRFVPRWSPDGRRIAFTYFPPNAAGRASTSMWWISSDGRGEPEPIGNLMSAYPAGFSPDGGTLYFRYITQTETRTDLWSADLTREEAELRPLLATRANEDDPSPSPDGRWLAYTSDASGQDEIRIARLPDVSDPVQVTAGGGSIVGWRGDGRRFYYRVGTTIWELGVGPERVSTNPPVAAFAVPAETVSAEITPDGQRMVVVRGGPMVSELVVRQGVLAR
jgi:serine/threonine protein kinase/Tol biopolymer transport system component